MSSVYLARTNQKLGFVRIHLEQLKQAHKDTSWHKHALIESYNESVLFHLASGYDSFLREIAERYSVETESLDGYRSLVAALDSTGVESPEINQLVWLEGDEKSWLHKMLSAYEACWHGSDKRGSVSETRSLSEIHVLQVNPDHAEDGDIFAEYKIWFKSLSALIDQLREGMEEW